MSEILGEDKTAQGTIEGNDIQNGGAKRVVQYDEQKGATGRREIVEFTFTRMKYKFFPRLYLHYS